jgi:hypothetical protein
MLGCAELISSRLDDDVIAPIDRRRFGTGRWRLTYLPPAVAIDDRSRWVNRAPISRLIAATEAEYRSIAGDGTPYVLTGNEVVLTGSPRHDRLLRLAHDPAVLASRRLLLIVPDSQGEPEGDEWAQLLASERLAEHAARAGLEVVLVPPHETGVDRQPLLARSAAIVTDTSPSAFELAYLGRPIIYFQPHRDGRRDECSFGRDGFGPIVHDVDDVLDELERLVEAGMAPRQPYATRIAEAFAFRDQRSSERVFESILAAQRPAAGRSLTT